MLAHVGQRLLDDPVDRQLHAPGQLTGLPGGREVDREPGGADLLEQLGQLLDARLRHVLVRGVGGPQHPEQAAHLDQRLAAGGRDGAERLLGLLR